jgi:hypothetical protein
MQEVMLHLWNPKVDHSIHNCLLSISGSTPESDNSSPTHLPYPFNSVIPSVLRSSKWSPHCLSHSQYDHPNAISYCFYSNFCFCCMLIVLSLIHAHACIHAQIHTHTHTHTHTENEITLKSYVI